MNKFLISLSLLIITSVCGYAQEIKEPQFIGEVLLVKSETNAIPLEKKTAKIKTKASASVYIAGIGSVRSRLNVDGTESSVRWKESDGPIVLIVRAANNETDPSSFIRIFKFQKKGKERRAEISKSNTFGGQSENNFDFIEFTGEKFGEKSYKITLEPVGPSEIGIIISNPDKVDEKQTIIRCLGID